MISVLSHRDSPSGAVAELRSSLDSIEIERQLCSLTTLGDKLRYTVFEDPAVLSERCRQSSGCDRGRLSPWRAGVTTGCHSESPARRVLPRSPPGQFASLPHRANAGLPRLSAPPPGACRSMPPEASDGA